MDYHSDRFADHSLMVYNDKGNLICCFPANEDGSSIISHGGLTYGSFIFKKDIKLVNSLEIIQVILQYYHAKGYDNIMYKAFPRIYNTVPSDEVDYALFLLKAELYRRDTAIVVNQDDRIKYVGNIRREAKKAEKLGCFIEESTDFDFFWKKLLIPNLNSRFGVNPVHNVDEIELLRTNFSNEIKLFVIKNKKDEVLAGAVFFLMKNVAHCQYIASSNEGRKIGALNQLFTTLMDINLAKYNFFDFGIVNENNGLYLNKGMLAWKERMGGRTISHDFYNIKTANWVNIEKVLNND
jgi:hypothetical protein